MSVFSWLRDWRADELHGRLQAIYLADDSGRPMRSVGAVEVIVGQGLAGDRYALGQGHWRLTDGCEVTLVSAEEIANSEKRSGLALGNGEHRRNLVVSGITLDALRKNELHIGAVRFAFHKLRPPCMYLDRLVGAGHAKALKGAGGVGLRVVEAGVIRVGDAVEIVIAP